jgi:hypothetical protein
MNPGLHSTGLASALARLLADARCAFRTLQHIQFDAPWQNRVPDCRD